MDARPVIADVASFAAGLAAGTLHFALLRWNASLYARPGRIAGAVGLQMVRLALLGLVLALIAMRGAAAAARGARRADRAAAGDADDGAMTDSPLALPVAFHVGPVAVTTPVVTTWAIMLLLAGGFWLMTRRLALRPSMGQAALELVVDAIAQQIRDTMRVEPEPFLPLIGTLFLFIFTANWSSLAPGVEPPTAHLETDAALALIVFVAVTWFGIRFRGLRGYLATFAEPTIVMIPLNIIETLTRTFSLVVRLFGNVMSGVFVIGILLSLLGLLVPVPLMALDLLTGAVQAYIFSVLAMVFIAGGLGGHGDKPGEAEAS